MLDLYARIDLDEVDVFGLVNEKLNRTRVTVIDVSGKTKCVFIELVFGLLFERNGGGYLDNFLEAALYLTIALE